MKILHIDPKVVNGIIKKLNQKFGNEEILTVTRGRVNSYLGMDIDLHKEYKVTIIIDKYVDEILEDTNSDMEKEVTII